MYSLDQGFPNFVTVYHSYFSNNLGVPLSGPVGCCPSQEGGPRALPLNWSMFLKISTEIVSFEGFPSLIYLEIFKIFGVISLVLVTIMF